PSARSPVGVFSHRYGPSGRTAKALQRAIPRVYRPTEIAAHAAFAHHAAAIGDSVPVLPADSARPVTIQYPNPITRPTAVPRASPDPRPARSATGTPRSAT